MWAKWGERRLACSASPFWGTNQRRPNTYAAFNLSCFFAANSLGVGHMSSGWIMGLVGWPACMAPGGPSCQVISNPYLYFYQAQPERLQKPPIMPSLPPLPPPPSFLLPRPFTEHQPISTANFIPTSETRNPSSNQPSCRPNSPTSPTPSPTQPSRTSSKNTTPSPTTPASTTTTPTSSPRTASSP